MRIDSNRLEQSVKEDRRTTSILQLGRPLGRATLLLGRKCLNQEEFIVVGWTGPAGSRSHFGALLLSCYTEDGRLHYARRVGTGFTESGSSAWRPCYGARCDP